MELEKKTRRIGVDVPTDFKLELDVTIPYGTLSSIIRALLVEFLKLIEDVGRAKALKALNTKSLTLTITEKDSQE